MQTKRNPFADRGPIVRDPSSLIGRQGQLKTIKRRLLQSKFHTNLAIIGERRIGASTLAYHATHHEDLWEKHRIIVALINVSSCQDAKALFYQIGRKLVREGEKKSVRIEGDSRTLLLNEETPAIDYIDALKEYFELLGEQKIKAICILDDFEKTAILFKNNISYFQSLRELGYYPDCRISLVIVSRRSISIIEEQSGAVSTLAAIFEDRIVLKPFSRDEMDQYFSFFERTGVRLSDKQKGKITFYCGGWPYLLNRLGYEIVEDVISGKQVDVVSAFSRIASFFEEHYRSLTRMLAKEERLDILLGMITGKNSSGNGDICEFVDSGLVREVSESPGYVAYSGHFQEYLENLAGKKADAMCRLTAELENTLVKLLDWAEPKKISEEQPSLAQIAGDSRLEIISFHLDIQFPELYENIHALAAVQSAGREKQLSNYKKNESISLAQDLLKKISSLSDVKKDILLSTPSVEVSLPHAGSFGIARIIIKDFYDIKRVDLDLSPESRWIFVTGENGFGKTLFLQALVVALHGGKAEWGGGQLAPEGFNSAIELYEGKQPILLNYKNKHFFKSITKIAAYGPSRLSIRQAESGDEAGKRSAPTYGIFHSDGVLLNIERKLLDLHKLAHESNNKAKQYAKQLELIKKILLQLLDQKITDIQTSGTRVRYREKNCASDRTLDKLASGFRSVIAMAGDIIIRLLPQDEDLEKTEQLSGIVLIDEFDLHLHPKYQKLLPGLLSKVFPNVLFIVSTHSPIPILGAPVSSTFLKVSKFDSEEKIKIEKLEIPDIRTLQPNILLSSPIFDMDEIFHKDKIIKNVRTEETHEDLLKHEQTRTYINEHYDEIINRFKPSSSS